MVVINRSIRKRVILIIMVIINEILKIGFGFFVVLIGFGLIMEGYDESIYYEIDIIKKDV